MPLRLVLGLCAGLLLAPAVSGEEAAAPQPFNVPAGKAERTLRIFAAQSRQSAVFTADMVQGVTTQAVKGDYTAPEALELMLAGTRLVPVTDRGSGALVIRSRETPEERIVELPPYVVEEALNPPWRYTAAAGFEILSRCSDELTLQLIDRQHRLHELLTLILPQELQVKRDVPATYILYSDTTQPVVTREMVEAIQQREIKSVSGHPSPIEAEVSVRFMPNYRFRDHDSLAMFFVVEETGRNDRSAITLTPGYLRYLLTARTPSLPPWFVEGMVELYGTVRLPAPPLKPRLTGFLSLADSMPSVDEDDVVTIRQAVWISEAHSKQIREVPAEMPLPEDLSAFLPLSSLFEAQHLETRDEAHRQLWRSQSALFIRWALDPHKFELIRRKVFDGRPPLEPHHFAAEALWKFVARASIEPVTEAMFRDCFGQDYEEVEARLRLYLRSAVNSRNNFELRPDRPPVAPKVELRDATEGEVGRLKGELQRLEIGYVRAFHPQLVPLYVEQARRALRKAYDAGDRDPRLLASLGLCECDAGDDGAARPLLEAAVKGGVIRPRAYYELARILYGELKSAHAARNPGLTESEPVLDLLMTSRNWAPPIPEVYELIAEIWLRSGTRLEAAQFAVMDEGLRLFSRHVRLIHSVAILRAMHGHKAEVQVLVERGLQVTVEPTDREQLLRLRSAMAPETSP